MRLRLGFLIGFATGYLLGSRAGRQRYEQIVAAVRRAKPADSFDTGSADYPYAGDGATVTGSARYSSSK
ncbi:MAG: hypothetical protein ACRD1K_09475 [Acidimicrobiales bacterium]